MKPQVARFSHRLLQIFCVVAIAWFCAAPTPSDRVDLNKAMTEKQDVPQNEEPKKEKAGKKLPFGKPVVGRPGFVLSPYAPKKGPIDVRKFAPGTAVKDPFTGETFLVPPLRMTGSNQ